MMRFVTLLTLLLTMLSAHSADTRQQIFAPSFRTLQVAIDGHPEAQPVMISGTPDRLTVSFDELSDSRRNLRYTLTHCDAAWQPSQINPSDYIDGFNEATVPDGEFSRSTLTHYVHYTISIPDDGLRPTLPGNYLLTVFDESSPATPLLQARFSVCDPEMNITADVSPRTDVDYLASHQQLKVSVDASQARVSNPYTDLKVIIDQNSRPETEVTLTSPTSVRGRTAIYDHLPALIFDGCNEYRRMEIISTQWPGMGIDRVEHDRRQYIATVMTDTPRADSQYTYDSTQHGRFTIREYNSANSDTEADYILTRFTLCMPELPGHDIYIEGDITGRNAAAGEPMRYDRETGCYTAELLLKQGAYNYQYVARKKDTGATTTAPTEGNFHNTTNRYNIRVYYRRPGERFDRLAGVTTVEHQ